MALNLDYSFLTWDLIRTFVVAGFRYSLQLTIVAMVGGVVLGTLIALMRLSSNRLLSNFAAAYVNLLRSVPLVMVILWFYLLIPSGFYAAIAGQYGLEHRPEFSAVITFTIFEAAYYSEIMRAGIQSVSRGQVWAGYALGLDYWQTMAKVVLPQAFRNMIPILLTQTIILFQDTSLVYVLSITDFLGAASKIAQRDGRLVEMYLFAALVYFLVSFALSLLVKRLQAKIAIIR